MEKARGKRPPSSFDRERVEIPTHQISFIEKVAMPVYKYVVHCCMSLIFGFSTRMETNQLARRIKFWMYTVTKISLLS